MSKKTSERQKATEVSNGHPVSIRWFISIIVTVSLFFAVFVYVSNPRNENYQVTNLTRASVLPAELVANAEFVAWLDAWQKEDPYVTQDEFVPAQTVDLVWSYDSSEHFMAENSVVSPDGKYSAGYLTQTGTSQAWLSQPGQAVLLESRRAPGYFQGLAWLSSTQVAFFGTEATYRLDDAPLCISSDDGNDATCYVRLTINVVDVVTGKMSRFVSEKHGFAGSRMLAGGEVTFAQVVKENLDTALVNGTTTLEGTVMMFDGSELVLSSAGGSIAKIKLNEDREVGLPDGSQVGLDVIRRGLRMRLSGDMDGDQIIATAAEVIELPGFIIYEPVAGAAVSQLTVRGIVGRGVDKIVVRVRNQNTGIRFFDRTIDVDAQAGDYWQLISEEVDLSTFASPGDKLTLSMTPWPSRTGRLLS